MDPDLDVLKNTEWQEQISHPQKKKKKKKRERNGPYHGLPIPITACGIRGCGGRHYNVVDKPYDFDRLHMYVMLTWTFWPNTFQYNSNFNTVYLRAGGGGGN